MDRQGNSYTFIYASVMVVVVATILAFISEALNPLQTRNEEVAKKSDILKSLNIVTTSDDAEKKYEQIIGDKSYILNYQGEKIEGNAFAVDLSKEVRKPLEERNYPVYEGHLESGETKYVLPMRGTGLWGPIWGYVALNDDKNTIYGASFDHKGETPGLGAEIAQRPFQEEFKGKTIFDNNKLVSIKVVKGGAPPDAPHAVDAISGGTITSQGMEIMLTDYFQGYEAFLKK